MSDKPDQSKLHRFSKDEKAKIVEDYIASKLTVKEYCNSAPMSTGSEVKVVVNGKTQMQQLVANNGTAQPEKMLHFGLGSATQASYVSIRWPNGKTTTYENLPAGGHEIQEISGKLSGL